MKVCLLVCDHVLPAFEPIDGNYPDMFQKLFSDLTLVPYYVCDGEFPAIDDYDYYLCTGSKFSVYEDIPWIKQMLDLIRNIVGSGKKFIGVCFGHQLIAQALNGEVTQSKMGWNIGVHEFMILSERLWMSPHQTHFNVLMLCQDQVSKMPKEAEILARSPTCPVGMFQIGNQFLGIQGHPEFSKIYNQALYTSRTDRIGSEVVMVADTSMKLTVHQNLLRDWMVNFLRS